MKILVLQFEEREGHYVFTPSLPEGEVVINLPPEAKFVTIVHNDSMTQIFATNGPAVEGWVVG